MPGHLNLTIEDEDFATYFLNDVSSTYGVLGYKDSSNFTNANFLIDIQDEVNRNKWAPYIKNFQSNYENGNIPFYALVEIFSSGTLSKFFKNIKNTGKKAIAETYGIGYINKRGDLVLLTSVYSESLYA